MNESESPSPDDRAPVLSAGDGLQAMSGEPRGFPVGWSLSAAAHLMILGALLWLHPSQPPRDEEPSPVLIDVMELPSSPPPGPPESQVSAETLEQALQVVPQPVPMPAIIVADVADPPVADISDVLSASQLASAMSAESEGAGSAGGGTGAGGCNTALILQRALQRDPMVRTAVADAGRLGQAVMLWNGDWIRSGHQDGKGLSGVRQAILWELAFAPEACRIKQMRGLVLFSLADGTRFAIGTDAWKWSDLLGLHPPAAER